MFKLIGVCLTLTACGYIGLTWARIYEKRPQQLTALEGALQLLETEIIYTATPLQEAMKHVSQRCDPDISELFRNMAAELEKTEGATAGEAWERAADDFYSGTALNQRDLHILKRFGASLGVSDREDQAKHLEMTRSQLRLASTQAETLSRKNSTIFKYMGFLSGLFLVLVLY